MYHIEVILLTSPDLFRRNWTLYDDLVQDGACVLVVLSLGRFRAYMRSTNG